MENIWKHSRKNVTNIGKLGILSNSDKIRIEKYTDFPNKIPYKDNCWIWIGTKQYEGKDRQHGSFWYNGRYVLIHRLLFHNFIYDVPEYKRKKDSIQVNHRCQSDGKCINPFHMYLGTPKQNTADCIRENNKRKADKGEKNHNAIVSDETVEKIKSLKGNTDKTQKQIAEEYGVNQSQISRWWNGKTR